MSVAMKSPAPKVWGAIYCAGSGADVDDYVPCIASTQAGSLYLIGSVLRSLSQDYGVDVPDEFNTIIGRLKILSQSPGLSLKNTPDYEWRVFLKQASVLRNEGVAISLIQAPHHDIPIMGTLGTSHHIQAGVLMSDNRKDIHISGVGDGFNAFLEIINQKNNEYAGNFTRANFHVLTAYTIDSKDRDIMMGMAMNTTKPSKEIIKEKEPSL